MKSSVAAIGMFAAIASAHLPNHVHFPRGNATTAAADSVTTLTVLATEVSTIISCAPTVTNCPADQTDMTKVPESDRSTMVVTNTVKLTETVCPVSDAPHISASVISGHNSGKVTGTTVTTAVHPTMPATNGGATTEDVAAETGSSAPSGSFTTSTTDIVTEKTLTMTMGTGSDASVIATVVQSTIKSTVTVPCDAATATGTAGDNEPTTTTTATSTSTRTITVSKATETNTDTTPDSTGEACDGAPTVTVTAAGVTETVTVPASTVFITGGCPTMTDSADEPTVTDKSDDGSSGSDNTDNGSSGDDNTDNGSSGDNNGDDGEDCPDETTTIQSTITVVPYPTGNGTAPMTSGAAQPSGFARLRR